MLTKVKDLLGVTRRQTDKKVAAALKGQASSGNLNQGTRDRLFREAKERGRLRRRTP